MVVAMNCYNVYVLSALESGIDIINSIKEDVKIQGIIGLKENAKHNTISGYVDMSKFCKGQKLKFVPVKSYDLKNQNDRQSILSLKIDILLVLGWQRLIPEWLINHCDICAIGVHGSSYGITLGRGRSPQNWSLILGKKKFSISIFKINTGVDSGEIIDTMSFTLSDFDDIKSCYYKTGLLISKMLTKNIVNIPNLSTKKQSETETKYLPQRTPDDGEIDWDRSTKEIYNFIRALTKPYPGAFSKFNDCKLYVWKAKPFELPLDIRENKTGEIIKIFHRGDLLIKTGDSLLLIEDYSLEPPDSKKYLQEGLIFSSCSFKEQMQKIIGRHMIKYTDQPIHDDIMELS
ncbi:MAG: hypothetical protein AUI92_07200 [Thaumarchaeota archaeon 13_1_40CM_3_38_6]|nr:MAG: hypothetical protein AUI92_07200 [Thaumarchaeota archaeon 13_1_40CM_3_38_6]